MYRDQVLSSILELNYEDQIWILRRLNRLYPKLLNHASMSEWEEKCFKEYRRNIANDSILESP